MVCTIMVAEILTTGEAAKILNLSTQRVRQLDAIGVLPSRRTAGGVRIFDRTDVEHLRRQREVRDK